MEGGQRPTQQMAIRRDEGPELCYQTIQSKWQFQEYEQYRDIRQVMLYELLDYLHMVPQKAGFCLLANTKAGF